MTGAQCLRRKFKENSLPTRDAHSHSSKQHEPRLPACKPSRAFLHTGGEVYQLALDGTLMPNAPSVSPAIGRRTFVFQAAIMSTALATRVHSESIPSMKHVVLLGDSIFDK